MAGPLSGDHIFQWEQAMSGVCDHHSLIKMCYYYSKGGRPSLPPNPPLWNVSPDFSSGDKYTRLTIAQSQGLSCLPFHITLKFI